MFDPAIFFAKARLVTGPLTRSQVDSVNALLAATKHWPVSWVAYALATAWHESRLMPIREAGGRAYLAKYDTGRLAARLGNSPQADGDGIKYAGRGFVQLTGLANYRKASQAIGVDMVKDPDLALVPANAVKVLVWGMETGAFTGRKLAIRNGTEAEFIEARRIINGTDRAKDIAGYAIRFQSALNAAGA